MRNALSDIEHGAAFLDNAAECQLEDVTDILSTRAGQVMTDGKGPPMGATGGMKRKAKGGRKSKPASRVDDDGKKKSQATILLELCANLSLFHDAEQNGYAVLDKPDHREVWPILSKPFGHWLGYRYFKLTGQGARGPSLKDALATIAARALHDAPERKVFLRVACLGDRIYIDLGDELWRVIEIDAVGWRLLERSPVMFTRRNGMAALPVPVEGKLGDLAQLVNLRHEDLPLIMGWLLMAARGCGPYPVLVLNGEQGTGKSTLARMLRGLIDPSCVALRGLNKDIRDLLVTATNNHVVVLDNLSGLSAEFSDALCRFATGGGFAARQLYTDRDEVMIEIQRPVLLNGIDEIATRGDLLERSIILQLPVIPDTARTDEASAWKRYEAMRPGLLGGLYTALSHALREHPTTQLKRKPRMADLALWVTAAEGALGWSPGTFMQAYQGNQDNSTAIALEASPFGVALVSFMARTPRWTGTQTELLHELERTALPVIRYTQCWPKTGKGVSNALKRLAPLLRKLGITIRPVARTGADGGRQIEIIKSG